MSSNLPQKLPQKLKQIRERAGLTPEDFAAHVHAPSGTAIIGYEHGTDMPASVLNAYAALSGVPLELLIDDSRDLWAERNRYRRIVIVFVTVGLAFVISLVLVTAYLIWDILSMYFRMVKEGGG